MPIYAAHMHEEVIRNPRPAPEGVTPEQTGDTKLKHPFLQEACDDPARMGALNITSPSNPTPSRVLEEYRSQEFGGASKCSLYLN